MRIHLLEHDPLDFSRTHITRWARERGHTIAQTYLCSGQALPRPDDFDWLMVMGGAPHVWEEAAHPWLADEKRFIAEVVDREKIVLGICFGAQLLAEILGGRVFPNEQEEIGWYPVHLTDEGRRSFLFRGLADPFVTFHWHADHFSLPPGGVRLASSPPTPNQAFVLAGRPVVGLQFHPEYTRDMVRRFAEEFGHEWKTGAFVAGVRNVLEQTARLQDPYDLAAGLLDNMVKEFVQIDDRA